MLRTKCGAFLALLLVCPFLSAQSTSDAGSPNPAGSSAVASLAALSQAFSQGQPVTHAVMRGTATWTAGSTTDSGPVTLTIAPDGSARMDLSIPSAGAQAEASSGSLEGRQCQWGDKTGTLHGVDSRNCWKTMLWFLPAYSLQPTVLAPSKQAVVDYGLTTVGATATPYRHLQSQFFFSLPTADQAKEVARVSTTDLGLDPATYLPAVLSYSLFPESGADTPIAVEVRYAQYALVGGVQLPFSIQRFINGSLQLDITISSADAH
jgi:hypothetical protein